MAQIYMTHYFTTSTASRVCMLTPAALWCKLLAHKIISLGQLGEMNECYCHSCKLSVSISQYRGGFNFVKLS